MPSRVVEAEQPWAIAAPAAAAATTAVRGTTADPWQQQPTVRQQRQLYGCRLGGAHARHAPFWPRACCCPRCPHPSCLRQALPHTLRLPPLPPLLRVLLLLLACHSSCWFFHCCHCCSRCHLSEQGSQRGRTQHPQPAPGVPADDASGLLGEQQGVCGLPAPHSALPSAAACCGRLRSCRLLAAGRAGQGGVWGGRAGQEGAGIGSAAAAATTSGSRLSSPGCKRTHTTATAIAPVFPGSNARLCIHCRRRLLPPLPLLILLLWIRSGAAALGQVGCAPTTAAHPTFLISLRLLDLHRPSRRPPLQPLAAAAPPSASPTPDPAAAVSAACGTSQRLKLSRSLGHRLQPTIPALLPPSHAALAGPPAAAPPAAPAAAPPAGAAPPPRRLGIRRLHSRR